MSDDRVQLVLLWHHHQPDYRAADDGRSVLPWVRLHGTKDYLDMAVRLTRHPRVRCAFNFVPSLLDQIDAAARGGGDRLFDRLKLPIAELTPGDLEEVRRRCSVAPRHALERWPAFRGIIEKMRRAGTTAGGTAQDRDWLRLETWFLLAWLDPTQLDQPEARAALGAAPEFTQSHRDGLLALYERLLGRIVPAYAELAARGQVELSTSPYYHPILPLLVDVASARRARSDAPLPREPFVAPGDARLQIQRAFARHERAFGQRPIGLWPPEGGVSPEVVALAAEAGVRWMATDEAVLWNSLEPGARRREVLYQPWKLTTDSGDMMLLFRDHELSDRIGFVYQHWRTEQAVEDFLERVRRVGRQADGPRVVSVILDGENCWEHYPEDGGPFLDALYEALGASSDIVTRTPSDVLASHADMPRLGRLHTGSWIDADFHIWVGHPEKNRGWELLSRTRRALEEAGATPTGAPDAWEALLAAEGSDWFWWFGDDHFTPDKLLFDQLFRSHLRAAHERWGLAVPSWLDVAVVSIAARDGSERVPYGFIHPVIDGRRTGFYEWHGAARFRLTAGGSAMHQSAGLAEELYFGYDATHLYLRVDFANESPPGEEYALRIELVTPHAAVIELTRLAPGRPPVIWRDKQHQGQEVVGAQGAVDQLVELAIPFTALGLLPGQPVELLGRFVQDGRPVETIPADDAVRFRVPEPEESERMWTA